MGVVMKERGKKKEAEKVIKFIEKESCCVKKFKQGTLITVGEEGRIMTHSRLIGRKGCISRDINQQNIQSTSPKR
jgi:hypothetical protein